MTYDRDEQGVRVARRGGGGLVTALRSLAAREDVSWIASAISDEDRVVAAEGGTADGLRLLAHDAAAYDLFYNVVANPLLWFVQHELWDPARPPAAFGRLEQGWRDGYTVVNQAFADAVCEELETHPDAVVFFQDYHLYLAPRLVRERFPDAVLAHFVHIPWAEPAGWNVLPEPIRIAVHDGLLANDLVGFHTERWLRRFTASAREILGAEPADGRTLCVARPISVDPAEYLRLADDPEVLDRQRRLAAGRPKRLLLRVERTDPSKNVVLGLRAFERYLDTHPEAAGRVGLLALLDPSRLEIPEYGAYLEEIRRTVAEINERLGDGRRTPIDLRVEDDFPGSVAAYKEYDVLLVTPVIDGLNLVAKEAPLVNGRDGVLVLSDTTGAYDELGEFALGVRPLDLDGQAEAIHRALTMPADERRSRLQAIREQVRTHDLAAWASALRADVDRVAASKVRP